MTGAGRSTAAKELEDLGFYVVDNLPPSLLKDVVRLVDESRGTSQPIAVVVDVRSGAFFASLEANLAQGATGRHATLVFLEASDEVLVRRQEAARRPHPLQGSGRLLDGLERERKVLAGLRGSADLVIDTIIVQRAPADRPDRRGVRDARDASRLKVSVVSFGFKYGIPVDADFLADMRFLPNPLLGRRAAPAERPGRAGRRTTSSRRPGPPSSSSGTSTCSPGSLRLPARGQAVRAGRDRLHRRQAPQRGDDRGDRARLVERGIDARAAHRDLGRE